MGFRLSKKTARIKFEGTDYDGAEVVVNLSLSIEQMFRIQDLLSGGDVIEGFRDFGDIVLVSWNLEDDDGNPIPANGEGYVSMRDRNFHGVVMERWVEAINGVPVPLESPSPSGSTSEAEPTRTAAQ